MVAAPAWARGYSMSHFMGINRSIHWSQPGALYASDQSVSLRQTSQRQRADKRLAFVLVFAFFFFLL